MTTVFIAGSINIKNLDRKVKDRIDNIITSNYQIVVGDAKGADSSIQSYLDEQNSKNTVVYCTGDQPRNNIGSWPVNSVISKSKEGTRAYFTAKDIQMADTADYGLMIWDSKSTGTLSNVIELLKQKKKSVVFVNKNKEFKVISDVSHLDELVMFMSENAQLKADSKIGLFNKIKALNNEQMKMFD